MKKLLVLLLAALLLVSVAACKAPETQEAQPDASAPAEQETQAPQAEDAEAEAPAEEGEVTPKVAFIIPGPISDMSWCYTAYLGCEMVQEAGYEATYQENVTTDMLVESVRLRRV